MPLEPSPLRRQERERESMHPEQTVHEMVQEVLQRQAKVVLKRSGCSAQQALEAVSQTRAGSELAGLRDGPHAQKWAGDWQEALLWERAFERLEGMVRLDAVSRIGALSTEVPYYYLWVEGYMERLEGKEARAEYYMLLEAARLARVRG
jgi:hypothetical protein